MNYRRAIIVDVKSIVKRLMKNETIIIIIIIIIVIILLMIIIMMMVMMIIILLLKITIMMVMIIIILLMMITIIIIIKILRNVLLAALYLLIRFSRMMHNFDACSVTHHVRCSNTCLKNGSRLHGISHHIHATSRAKKKPLSNRLVNVAKKALAGKSIEWMKRQIFFICETWMTLMTTVTVLSMCARGYCIADIFYGNAI